MPLRLGVLVAALAILACRRAPALEPSPLDAPTPYVERLVEVHLGSPSGPVVARAHPGASLDVARAEAGQVLVSFPAFAVKEKLYADAAAFGTKERPLSSPARQGRLVKDMPALELYATPGERSPFASSLCGELRVIEEDGAHARVAQTHRGVELLGWLDGPLDVKRGPIRCVIREVRRETDGRWMLSKGTTEADVAEVRDVPEGFVRAEEGANDGLAPFFAAGGSVYWLHVSPARRLAACRRWTFGRIHEDGEGVLALEQPIRVEGQRAFASFLTLYAPDERRITLLGPHFGSRPRDRPRANADLGGYRCGTSYTFVGTRDGALRMFPGAPSYRLVAWHPDDEERWFLGPDACEAAAKKATDALAHDPEAAPPGGVHVDCYPELEP